MMLPKQHLASGATPERTNQVRAIPSEARPLRIDVWTDFLCPFCYLTSLRVERLAQAMPAEIVWHAFMLRPPAAPRLHEDFRGIVEAEYRRIGYDIANEFGIQINPGPIGLRTYAAHLATQLAQSQGLGAAFHRAVMQAYWLEGQVIDDAGVLERIGRSVGVSGAVVDPDRVTVQGEAALRADQEAALAFGARSVPLVVLDRRIILRGAVAYDTLFDAAADALHLDPLHGDGCGPAAA